MAELCCLKISQYVHILDGFNQSLAYEVRETNVYQTSMKDQQV
jgi:hypothetical protein